jgi:hypothetical protein
MAEQVARWGRFGQWEERRLDEAIRHRLLQSSPPSSELLAAGSMLRFLVLSEALGSTGEDTQLANVIVQNPTPQTVQTMSNIMRMQHDTMMNIIRNLRA